MKVVLILADMTIPVIAAGKDFAPGRDLGAVHIQDIAPTVSRLPEL